MVFLTAFWLRVFSGRSRLFINKNLFTRFLTFVDKYLGFKSLFRKATRWLRASYEWPQVRRILGLPARSSVWSLCLPALYRISVLSAQNRSCGWLGLGLWRWGCIFWYFLQMVNLWLVYTVNFPA